MSSKIQSEICKSKFQGENCVSLNTNSSNFQRREFLSKFAKIGAGFGALSLMPVFVACSENKNNATNSSDKANLGESSSETSAQNSANSSENLATSQKGQAMTNSTLNEFFTLQNGVKVPKLGLGLWRIDNDKVSAAIEAAVNVGYRHFDSAQAYANEAGTGEGVRNAIAKGLKREELFVTTKVAAEHKSYEAASASIEQSLAKLGLDYVDLMLIHAPQPWNDFRGGDYFEGNAAAWRALEEAYKEGKVRAIGVSNFLQKDLANIFANCAVKPMVNQVLCHIGNTPFELIEHCKNEGLLVQAYSPIAHGELLRDERLVKIAANYGVSVPQLCIRYCLELGVCPLPKSANPAHIASNAQVDFKISEADLTELKNLSFKNYGEHSYFPVFSGK